MSVFIQHCNRSPVSGLLWSPCLSHSARSVPFDGTLARLAGGGRSSTSVGVRWRRRTTELFGAALFLSESLGFGRSRPRRTQSLPTLAKASPPAIRPLRVGRSRRPANRETPVREGGPWDRWPEGADEAAARPQPNVLEDAERDEAPKLHTWPLRLLAALSRELWSSVACRDSLPLRGRIRRASPP